MVEHLLGLLRVRVARGVNLAVRDVTTSDPYVVLRMGKQWFSLRFFFSFFFILLQKLKTRVIKKNTNPVWNEDLTLCIEDPSLPVRLQVFDKDRFTKDDAMGHAEFDIRPFLEAVKMNPQGVPEGTIIRKVVPCRQNCLAEESVVRWCHGQVTQDLALRLKDVERGEVELQLQWVDIPGAKGL
ncbi:unnamed protein product [Musa acuminata subsp. malaccensis]|uniref:(wild Malaysian banana) hypothetical protein n=1 Tax=Musa acuminata subsp. malaccensis TaxID=214687 RepID=A0A804JEC3_MUSAM|nr:unnamed protein product [Musa acuminata subsp. malaccensis]